MIALQLTKIGSSIYLKKKKIGLTFHFAAHQRSVRRHIIRLVLDFSPVEVSLIQTAKTTILAMLPLPAGAAFAGLSGRGQSH